MAKLTIRVIDEKGDPIEGANIKIRFQGGSLDKDATRGMTDSKGVFSASGLSADGVTGGGVTKTGYYNSTFHFDFFVSKLGIWYPLNKELTVTLRQKIDPVPMYVRNCTLKIPYLGKEIGFDLMKSDWVIPYGQGVVSDFIFKADLQFKDVDNFDATLTITFSNENNGIQLYKEDRGGDFTVGSRFRLPRYAPESGYQPKLVKRMFASPYHYGNDSNKDNNLFFRVRSEIENGKLKRAMYGKIKEDIAISINPEDKNTVRIHMLYYLLTR